MLEREGNVADDVDDKADDVCWASAGLVREGTHEGGSEALTYLSCISNQNGTRSTRRDTM